MKVLDKKIYLASKSPRRRELLRQVGVEFELLSLRADPARGVDVSEDVNGAEPYDKAGAYGIQGLAALFIEHIEGSHSGIMGLPVFETAQLLRKAGVPLL